MPKNSQTLALKSVFLTIAFLADMNATQAQEASPRILQKIFTLQIQQRPVTNPHDPNDTRMVNVDCGNIGMALNPKTGQKYPAPTGAFVSAFDLPPFRPAMPHEDSFAAGTADLVHIGSRIDGENGLHQLCAYQAAKLGKKASKDELSGLPDTDVACPVKAAMKICTGGQPQGYQSTGNNWVLEY